MRDRVNVGTGKVSKSYCSMRKCRGASRKSHHQYSHNRIDCKCKVNWCAENEECRMKEEIGERTAVARILYDIAVALLSIEFVQIEEEVNKTASL